nr:immunoglobulin heavy chain junction region [Macaca mulatta]MOV36171.1 immunoglobulin heavy chain junction region [Macaca mulatta]
CTRGASAWTMGYDYW